MDFGGSHFLLPGCLQREILCDFEKRCSARLLLLPSGGMWNRTAREILVGMCTLWATYAFLNIASAALACP